MNVYLRTADGVYKVFWLASIKMGVIGWSAMTGIRSTLGIAEDGDFHVHFNYPLSGNYHISYKRRTETIEEYITVFFDRVKTKLVGDAESEVKIRNRADMDPDDPMSILVPPFHQKPLAQIKSFQFFVMGFNVFDGLLASKKFEKYIGEVSSNDLVVDVSGYKQANVNVYAQLLDHEHETHKWPDADAHYEMIIPTVENKRVAVVVTIFPYNEHPAS